MLEHIEAKRTLYRIHYVQDVWREPWRIQKWRWWWPFWVNVADCVNERHAHLQLEMIQRNSKFYEL